MGASIGAISLGDNCTAGPAVELTKFEVEAVAYLSDGVDKLRAASDTNGRDELFGGEELLLMGVRSALITCCPAALEIQKGVMSRGDDTVALCVAQRAADILGTMETDT